MSKPVVASVAESATHTHTHTHGRTHALLGSWSALLSSHVQL